MFNQSLKYISSHQQPDGSFLSLSSPNPINFSESLTFKTIFSNALILSCLCSLEQTFEVKEISKKLSSFLSHEQNKNGSFNYWSKDCAEFHNLPYPDDLDDTFCALSALYLYDKKTLNAKGLAKCVQLLTSCEVEEGGPYKTWLEAWQDVDAVVNANIGYFLFLQDISLPNLEKLFKETVAQKHFTSPYYPTPYPCRYFLSRFIKGPTKRSLVKILLESHPETSLDTALTISALLNMGAPTFKVASLVKNLIAQQSTDGSWPATAFYTGVNPHRDRTFYGGSQVLTTAFCLEALHKYDLATTSKPVHDSSEIIIYNQIADQTQKLFETLPDPLNQIALTQLDKIKKREKIIFLLPFLFGREMQITLPDQFFIELGKANVLGWIAYTICDDFLDNEGDPALLSCANFCLRQLTTIFLQILPENRDFQKLFSETMNQLDASNSWEVTHCRLKNTTQLPSPDLQKISQKSAGHALGPYAILFAAGREDQLEKFQQFFHHYLVAKQLNDDAHDVFEDYKKGFATPVVIQLLTDYKNKYPHTSVKTGKLTQLFWSETIKTVCQQILSHCQQAKKLADGSEFLLKLIAPLEKSATQALTEHQQAQQFLKEYDINRV